MFFAEGGGPGVAEAVHCSGEVEEGEVGFALSAFFHEGGDGGGGDEGVFGSVADEEACFEGGVSFGELDAECAMEGGGSDEAFEVEGGHLEGDFSAHAVADGDDLGAVDFGSFLKGFHAGEKAFLHDGEFGSGFLGE